MNSNEYHIPVLLEASLEGLDIKEGGTYVDVTFGGGGHSREILKRIGKEGKLVAFDRDADARENLLEDERLVFIAKDFKFLETALKMRRIEGIDGILADLGVSSHQLDTPDRGFSYRFDAPLDMRMDTSHGKTAAEVLNEADEDELVMIFSQYGEIPNSKKLARTIVLKRSASPITHTQQLEGVIRSCIPQKRRLKYLSQLYQALRIEVNDEMTGLKLLLRASLKVLNPGGRIAVISYHSLEDRLVKRFLKAGNFEGKEEKDFYGNLLTPWKLISRRAIQASEEEVMRNSRARSARLRVAEKK